MKCGIRYYDICFDVRGEKGFVKKIIVCWGILLLW